MHKILTITLFTFLLLSGTFVFSQNYTATKLDLFTNKPDVFIDEIATDSKGFIWFLSKGKIYRYNGYRSLDVIATLPFNVRINRTINHILIDKDDKLWIAGIKNLYFLNLKTWQLQKFPLEKLPKGQNLEILDIKLSPANQVFVWYNSGDVVILDGSHTTLIPRHYLGENKPGTSVWSFAFWNQLAWLASSSGELYSISLDADHNVQAFILEKQSVISNIIPQDDFLLIHSWSSGFFQVRLTNSEKPDIQRINKYYGTAAICAKTWEYKASKVENSQIAGNKAHCEARKLFIEKMFHANNIVDINDIEVFNSDLLLATSDGIWAVYEKTEGISTLIPQNTVNKSVRDIYQFQDGSLFFCSYGGSEYIQGDGKIKAFNKFRGGYCFMPIGENKVLIGLEGGMATVFDKEKIGFVEFEYHLPDSLKIKGIPPPQYVLSLAQDDEQIYFGTLNSLWKLNKETRILVPAIDRQHFSSNLIINYITLVKSGLLLSTSRGLFQYNDGSLKKLFPEKGNLEIYKHISLRDTLWLATRGSGVVGLDSKRNGVLEFNAENGLSGNIVYNLIEANGFLVVATGNGLNIIKDGKIKRLNEKDGIVDDEFNRSASFYSPKTGKLYLGGLKGYTVLDMAEDWLTENGDLKNYISEVNVVNPSESDESNYYSLPYIEPGKLELKPGQNVVKLAIGNPQSFKSNPNFEYKMSKLTGNWQQMPQNNEITLMGIPVGDQDLYIKPLNSVVSNFLHLEFVQLPAFYQTWWFRILVFSLLPLILWLWYRSRLNKIKKEQALRTKIAADLHDEVGGLLTGISMQAEYLMISKKEKMNKSFLSNIVSSSNAAVQSMSEIVWSIDSRNDTWENFVARLREYSRDLYKTSPTALIFKTEGKPTDKLTQNERVALFRIFKEALNNSCKYARASEVKVLIKFLQNQVMLCIEDDGVGDSETKNIPSGQGIKNMRSRAESIQAKFEFEANRNGVKIIVLTKKKIKSHPFG